MNRARLTAARNELAAAVSQSTDSDDQIIMGKVREALELLDTELSERVLTARVERARNDVEEGAALP